MVPPHSRQSRQNAIYVNACNFVIFDGSKWVVGTQIVPKYVLECVSDDKSSINYVRADLGKWNRVSGKVERKMTYTKKV